MRTVAASMAMSGSLHVRGWGSRPCAALTRRERQDKPSSMSRDSTQGIVFRRARFDDARALADFRWRLHIDDADLQPDPEWVAAFIERIAPERDRTDVTHWLAEADGRPVGVMTVRTVGKVPSPGDLDGKWGYLTNCYVLPECRDQRVGSGLLEAVRRWAEAEAFELLVVWPSERAFPFYERAGFKRYADPLVLKLAREET
ncbi:MAG: GNAT family N-acetyltransferase [Caulobacterales bacterium]